MEKLEKENKRLQILIIILMALLIAFGGNYFYENVIAANKNNGNTNKEDINNIITSNDDTDSSYEMGDDVILSSVSNVNYSGIGFPDENGDFSQWKVLKEDGMYVTLYYTGNEFNDGKADKDYTVTLFNKYKPLFVSNGIDFGDEGEIRILSDDDLSLLECNFETLTCSNAPDWIRGWTSYVDDNYKYHLSDGKLNSIPKDEPVLAYSNPIIKILKSNIK